MVFVSARNDSRRASNQRLLAAAGGVFCIALIIVAVVLHPREPQEEKAEATPSDGMAKVPNKTNSPWSLALGNVVTIAPDLGLTIKGLKAGKVDSSRLAAILESQLTPLRDIYRTQSEKQPTLLGALLLEIVIGDEGRVTQVKELHARIADAEFRKLVLAEVKNWNFKDTLPDGATIQCPLLFVREGMEVTTLVKWEKNLGLFESKAGVHAPTPPAKPAPAVLAPAAAAKPAAEQAQN